MDEVQLEDHSFWHFFDSSQQLVIDTATKKNHKKILIFISIYSIIVILFGVFAPKTHKVKFVESPLSDSNLLNAKSSVDTYGLDLYNRTVSIFFAVQRKPHIYNRNNTSYRFRRHQKHQFMHSPIMMRDFQVKANIKYFTNNSEFKNIAINIARLSLLFSHHHVLSDTVKVFDIYGENAENIHLDFNVSGNFYHFSSIWYLISVNNPYCQTFNHYVCHYFIIQALVFIIYILFTCQRRYEQVCTLTFYILSLLTSISYIFSYNYIWQIMPKIMVLYLQLYMFYMISYVANKQRTIITSFSLILFVISFCSDLFSLMFNFRSHINITHGHNLLWHHITIAVSLSTIAAMRSSIDDFAAFVIYTACLCINMFSFWTFLDLTFFFPRLHHFINFVVMSLGMNSIVMCMLFAYHRADNGTSRRDQKPNSVAMNERL